MLHLRQGRTSQARLERELHSTMHAKRQTRKMHLLQQPLLPAHQPLRRCVPPVIKAVPAHGSCDDALVKQHAWPDQEQQAKTDEDTADGGEEHERPGPEGEGQEFAPSGQSLLFVVALGLGEVVEVEVAVCACGEKEKSVSRRDGVVGKGGDVLQE